MDLSTEELARQAGTTSDRVERMRELDILAPETGGYRPADIARVRVAEAFHAAGVSLEDFAAIVSGGFYSMGWIDTLFPDPVRLGTKTYAEACEEGAIPVEVASRLFVSALQLPAPGPDRQMRTDEEELLRLLSFVFQLLGQDPDAATASARYFGDHTRRIAESQVRWFRTFVEQPLFESGVSHTAALDTLVSMVAPMTEIGERAVTLLHRRHLEHYALEDIVKNVEIALEEAGLPRPRSEHPSTIAFMDLSDSTRYTEERGDAAAAQLAGELGELALTEASRNRGVIVKLLGDGAMLRFEDPSGAARCGLELLEAVRSRGFPEMRMGIHLGPVVFRDGDYYGRTVIVAARVTDQIGPGEVVLTGDAVGASAAEDLSFRPLGPVTLKGVADQVSLFRAGRASPGS